MKLLSDKELGKYLPSFFFIKIDTDNSFENLNDLMQNESFSVFIHEYTHFLQDILTTWGLRFIIHIVDKLKTANRSIYYSTENSFQIPFVIDADNICGVNNDLVSVYMGDDEISYKFNKIICIQEVPNDYVENYKSTPYIELTVLDVKDNDQKKIHFGAICVIESMAHLVQSKFYETQDTPQFPYRMVEHIYSFYFPEITVDKDVLLALCDAALGTTDPGGMLITFMKKMQEKKHLPKSPNDIYSFVRDFTYTVGNDKYDAKELFDFYSLKAEKSLTEYFTDDYYEPAKDWIAKTLGSARKMKLEDNFSFVDLVDNATGAKKIIDIVNKIGVPLIANNKGYYWAHHPQTNSEHFAGLFNAINEVYNILFNRQTYCAMRDYCKTLPEGDMTCDYCDNSPWEMSKKDKLCGFAQIWKLWGLSTKRPVLGR